MEVTYLHFLAFHLFQESAYTCTDAHVEIQSWMSSSQDSYHTCAVRLYSML